MLTFGFGKNFLVIPLGCGLNWPKLEITKPSVAAIIVIDRFI